MGSQHGSPSRRFSWWAVAGLLRETNLGGSLFFWMEREPRRSHDMARTTTRSLNPRTSAPMGHTRCGSASLIFPLCLLIAAPAFGQQILYVDADAPGANDGSSSTPTTIFRMPWPLPSRRQRPAEKGMNTGQAPVPILQGGGSCRQNCTSGQTKWRASCCMDLTVPPNVHVARRLDY